MAEGSVVVVDQTTELVLRLLLVAPLTWLEGTVLDEMLEDTRGLVALPPSDVWVAGTLEVTGELLAQEVVEAAMVVVETTGEEPILLVESTKGLLLVHELCGALEETTHEELEAMLGAAVNTVELPTVARDDALRVQDEELEATYDEPIPADELLLIVCSDALEPWREVLVV